MNLSGMMKDLFKIIADYVKEVIGIFDTQNIGETNMLLVAAANLVAKRLGVRKPTAKRSDESYGGRGGSNKR